MNQASRAVPAVLLSLLALGALAACDRPDVAQGLPELSRPTPAEGPRRIQVLFLGHASEHHDSGEYAPMLAAALGAEGIDITYTEDPDDLNPEGLALFDALIVYANHDSITVEQNRALLDFVASGKGFVPIHSASYCFRNSEEYVELVGAQFLRHGYGTFTAEIVHADHPALDGIEPFETWDETYVHHMHNDDRTVLMERVDDEGREPWSWVRTHGNGRVFYTAYGHDERTWSQPAFHRLIRNAILWAVGDEVREQLEAYDVPALAYVEDAEAPIPNYERRPEPLPLQRPLSPEESIRHWQVPPGFRVELFASEPMIVNPIAFTWDERGRLWVVETVDYPNDPRPDGEGNDVIRILEDTDGDGRADASTVFAEGLSIPTGITFANGGVIVSHQPEFFFLADTDGDDRADVRRSLLPGWGTGDRHAGPSNLHWGFDNWIWGSVGYSGFNGEVGGERMRFGAGLYRFRPDGSEMEVVAGFTNNTWGLGFSEAFDVFGSTANNEHSVYVPIPERYYEEAEGLEGVGRKKIDGHYAMHPITFNIRQVDSQGGFTAAAGHDLYTARSYPREYWNRVALVSEPTGNLLHRAVLERDGSGYTEVDGWNLMASADEWASPVHAQVGPDGAVWVADWYNFIVQHNPTPEGFETGVGNAYVTPLRDKHHGRIYRVVYEGAPAYEPMSLSPDRPGELVAALRHPNMFWRTTAQRLLVERGQTDVVDDLYGLVEDRSVDPVGLNSPAVHAIWTLHGLGVLDGSNARAERVVRGALTHPAAGVRKNAAMALRRNEETLDAMLEAGLLDDPDANVLLHALLALAEMPASESLGRMVYERGQDGALLADEWLPTALYMAAFRHRDGFLLAYAEDVGTLEFAELVGRAARGELEEGEDWSGAALDHTEWDEMSVPAFFRDTPLGPFAGIVWLRREVELPEGAAGRGATLRLGPINDSDVTWVNGVEVGSTADRTNEVREYVVPPAVLRAGRNVVAVRVSNDAGRGGVWGDADSLALAGDGFRVALAGPWRYRVEREWEGGGRPDFVEGIPFARQFLMHHNPAGPPPRDPAPGGFAGRGGGPPPFTVALSAVAGENRYDQPTITVPAGRRVTIAFDNTDDMPHNVVVLERGASLEEVGTALDEFADDPGAEGVDFVPDLDGVLGVMPMVDPRESGSLTFIAPSEPGDYPFVCSFPGHWLTMRGVLRVEG